MGGSRVGRLKIVRNIFVIFIVSGFWHGANWTFIIWGALNAIYFLPLLLLKRNRRHTDIVAQGRLLPNFTELLQIGCTLSLTVLAWVFFRSQSVTQAFEILRRIFSRSILTSPSDCPAGLLILIGILVITEWFQRNNEHGLVFKDNATPRAVRWCIYYLLGIFLYIAGGTEQQFIYFQF